MYVCVCVCVCACVCEDGAKLPPVNDLLAFGSLLHSHFNYFLRCAHFQVACDHEDIAVNGIMSLDKIRKRDPVMADFCATGLKWRVLHPAIRTEKPESWHMCSFVLRLWFSGVCRRYVLHHVFVLEILNCRWLCSTTAVWQSRGRCPNCFKPHPQTHRKIGTGTEQN